ncbi:protein LEG1 homolog [Emydura macquarii macquarii]|uniref:protein LEG1 homolog n=1 Tax=Emydura macquarii macquarii TaxID=1129001 RepID=UPI00352A2595
MSCSVEFVAHSLQQIFRGNIDLNSSRKPESPFPSLPFLIKAHPNSASPRYLCKMVLPEMCVFLGQHFLLLVLLTAVALSPPHVAAVIQEDASKNDVYPPLWHHAPGNIEDFPVHDNKSIISAWNYQERLGVYKILLNYSAKYFTAFGSNNTGNILWGLPLQHGWQYDTGRLADPSNVTTCSRSAGQHLCISARSWWACVNYYLAIIPFLGAVEAGFFGQLQHEIEILPPEELRADFCYSTADCRSRIPKVMDGWKAYFEYLLSTEQKSERPSAPSFSIEKEKALHYLWKAHVASNTYAVPKFRNSLKYLSGPEASFGEDWANAVDFIAATHFSSDLRNINRFQAFLPQRMLSEGDKAPFISDFSPQQNKILLSLCALHKTNKLTGGTLLLLWRMAMSTDAGRAVGRSLIENLITI